MATFTIRPFSKADEQAVMDLWYRSTVEGHPFVPQDFWASQRDGIRRVLLPLARTWVAEDEGRIVGFISVLENLIADLFVEPSRQGLGIGSTLISYVRPLYHNHLYVEVFEKNRRALAFYEKCGFVFHRKELQEETGEVLLTLVTGS